MGTKKKEAEMDHTGTPLPLPPCQFDKWNREVLISTKKYKVVFKVRKDYLRIIGKYTRQLIGFIHKYLSDIC